MFLNGLSASVIFNMKNCINYFKILVVSFSVITILTGLVISSFYTGVINDYNQRLKTIAYTEGVDITLMCNILSCKAVKRLSSNEIASYININGMLVPATSNNSDKPLFGIKSFNNEYLTVIRYTDILNKTDYRFYIDDYKYLELVKNMLYMIYGIFLLIFSIFWVVYLYIKYKSDTIERTVLRNDLYNTLQRDLTESLNHEMGLPVAIIKSLLKELFILLYPCKFTKDGMCDFQQDNVDTKLCVDCQHYMTKRAADGIAVEYYSKMKLAIERIEAVLRVTSGAKHIRYSNGTISFYAIMKNIIDSVNSYTFPRVNEVYNNEALLKKYAVAGGLSNGEMLNLFNIMVNNSIEAKARTITFTADKVVDNRLIIYVSDDGRGIRDYLDNIVKDENIFKYGVSTKDAYGQPILATKWYQKLLYKLGFNILDKGTPRGVGLSVNKGILIKGGGDMCIHSTSSSGTTFKLTIPIKERRDAK